MAMTIAVTVLFVIAVGSLLISMRPAHFRIERSAQIAAPAATVFAFLHDFREWHKWSPWEKLDPSMKKTFSGAESGPGAEYAWVGNGKAGQGRMRLMDSKADESVSVQIEFLKPFAATNQILFKLSPTELGTRVQWIMEGDNGFAAKAFALLMNMDALVGKDFEEGLSNLNRVAQTASS